MRNAVTLPSIARFAGPLALALAALFTGAAIYILVAEQPARLLLDDQALLRQWQAAIGPATRMQASLAILTAICGFISWRGTGERSWLIGAAAMLINLPFTLLVIAPINAELLALPTDQAGATSCALIRRWGELHAVRAGLGLLTTGLFTWAVTRRG